MGEWIQIYRTISKEQVYFAAVVVVVIVIIIYRLTGRGKFIDENGKEWSGSFDGKKASQLKLKI